MNRRRPCFYFSLRSPYSWLAHHDLTTRHREVAERVQWRPFWEPDARSGRMLAEAGGKVAYTPMTKEKHLYILQDVRRLAADRGLVPTWPVDHDPCWEVAHLPYLLAKHQGRGRRYVALASRARWEEGRDLCDVATIGELARELGLDPAPFTGAAEDPDLRAEGVRALLDVHRDMVFGVPFFVDGFARFWGIDRLDAFAHAISAAAPAAAKTVGAPLVGPGGGDGGHAGGCG